MPGERCVLRGVRGRAGEAEGIRGVSEGWAGAQLAVGQWGGADRDSEEPRIREQHRRE